MLCGVALPFQFAELFGDFSLLGQMGELFFQFQANIVYAQQILARVANAQFGFAAAIAVFRHTCRFLKKYAQFLRFGLNNARDHALFNNGVCARAQPGTEENVGNILASDVLVVDVIIRIAIPLQHAFDGNFGITGPLPGCLAQRIIENQLDAGT